MDKYCGNCGHPLIEYKSTSFFAFLSRFFVCNGLVRIHFFTHFKYLLLIKIIDVIYQLHKTAA